MLVIKSELSKILFIKGKLIVSNSLLNKIYSLKPNDLFWMMLEIVSSIAKDPIYFYQLVKISSKVLKLPTSETTSMLENFIKLGILTSCSTITAWDKLIDEYPQLNEVFYFLSCSNSLIFADYSNNKIYNFDYELMNEYKRESEPPVHYKSIKNIIHYIILDRKKDKNSNIKLVTLSNILYFCFGCLEEFQIMGLKAMLKAVPSHGARHPFEAYLISKNNDLLADGVFHYNSHKNTVELFLDPGTEFSSFNGLYLVITIVFDRVCWRYRNSWHYNDIFFDLGHIMGQLTYLSKKLDFTMVQKNLTFNLPFFEALIEEPVMIIKLENI